MHVYLLRHTRPDVPPETCYGQSDIEVIERDFQEHLQRLDKLLPLEQIESIHTSPLKRCGKLARSLQRTSTSYIVDPRIKELNFGEWELQHWQNINGADMRRWKADFLHAKAPGGESHMDLYKRAEAFWNDLTQSKEKHILVVTHGGVIKSLLSKILHMPLEKSYAIKLNYGALIYTHSEQNIPQQLNFIY